MGGFRPKANVCYEVCAREASKLVLACQSKLPLPIPCVDFASHDFGKFVFPKSSVNLGVRKIFKNICGLFRLECAKGEVIVFPGSSPCCPAPRASTFGEKVGVRGIFTARVVSTDNADPLVILILFQKLSREQKEVRSWESVIFQDDAHFLALKKPRNRGAHSSSAAERLIGHADLYGKFECLFLDQVEALVPQAQILGIICSWRIGMDIKFGGTSLFDCFQDLFGVIRSVEYSQQNCHIGRIVMQCREPPRLPEIVDWALPKLYPLWHQLVQQAKEFAEARS